MEQKAHDSNTRLSSTKCKKEEEAKADDERAEEVKRKVKEHERIKARKSFTLETVPEHAMQRNNTTIKA